MIKIIKHILFSIIFLGLCQQALASQPKRIIAIGGAITEIIYALNGQDKLIANDTTSYFPEAARNITKIGYQRALSSEGILSLNPDLIIMTDQAGPPAVIKQLSSANLRLLTLNTPRNITDIISNIRTIGDVLNKDKEAQDLIAYITKKQALVNAINTDHPPKILIVHHHHKGAASAAGKNTAGDAIITLSGGINAISEFSYYKTISTESLIAKNPDIVIIATPMAHEMDSESLKNNPVFKNTTAFKKGHIYVFDALEILGFGPRTADIILRLNQLYHNL